MSATRGRPRNSELTHNILEATASLLSTGGLAAATSNAIAHRAGVGKGAIYRRWAHLDDLLLDALLSATAASLEVPGDTPPLDALQLHVRELARLLANPRVAGILRALIARAQSDAELAERFRLRWIQPRRHVARGLLNDAVTAGALPQLGDADAVIDLLVTPLYFRVLLAPHPLSPEEAARRATAVMDGIRNSSSVGSVPDSTTPRLSQTSAGSMDPESGDICGPARA